MAPAERVGGWLLKGGTLTKSSSMTVRVSTCPPCVGGGTSRVRGMGLPSTLLGPEGTARMGGVALNGPSRLLGEPPTVVLVGRGSGWDRP